MGQIFYACAYDTETKTCCTMDADKFHANCYAHSGAVCAIHYLLRQKAYRVMWGGGYVCIDDNLADFSRTEDLLGISTYENFESFELNNADLSDKSYYDKAKFIGDNSTLWNRIRVWDEAKEYFDYENTRSVKYSGYLLNHTQKLAIDLSDYFNKSKFVLQGLLTAIDAVPVLTETGGGTQMALFNGNTTDSTEELAEEWCGDLLQIVDEAPSDYKLINCCIAEVWQKATYCYYAFGVNEDALLQKDSHGNLFEAAKLNFYGKRSLPYNIQAEVEGDSIVYRSVQIQTE